MYISYIYFDFKTRFNMDPFFMYISIGALVLLIIVLIVIGVSMSSLKSLDPFPPTQNACPDYWDVSSNPQFCGVPFKDNKNLGQIVVNNSTGVDPTNVQNIGMCTAGADKFGCVKSGGNTYLPANSVQPSSNFQYIKMNNNTNWQTMYPGLSERCSQRKWANTMGISWDGVSNFNGC